MFIVVGLLAMTSGVGGRHADVIGLIAGLVGLMAPAVWLVRLRRAYRSTLLPDEQSGHHGRRDPQFGSDSETSGPQNSTDNGTTWYYVDGGARKGPLPESRIIAMLVSEELPTGTMVWRHGMSDWINASQSELASKVRGDSPPPLAPHSVSNGFAWALALAPLWVLVPHYLLAMIYFRLQTGGDFVFSWQIDEAMQKTWWFSWSVNATVAQLDLRYLRSAGWQSNKLNGWLTILVPVYLYKRDQLLGAGVMRFLIWIGAFIVSLLPIW